MTTPLPSATLRNCLDGVARRCWVLGPAERADLHLLRADRQRPEDYLVVQTWYSDRTIVRRERVR